jgi:hypothetical protein
MRTSTWNEPGYSSGSIWTCLALLLPFSGAALAQDRASPSPLRIELNRIEAAGENCRFPRLSCSRFGRVLLNDIMTCEGAVNSRGECLSALETFSKIDTISFTK